MSDYLPKFIDARRVSAPFVVVRTPDLPATAAECFAAAQTVKSADLPTSPLFIAWDCARGMTLATAHGAKPTDAQRATFDAFLKNAGIKQAQTVDPTEAIIAFTSTQWVNDKSDPSGKTITEQHNAPRGAVLALHNIHRHWSQPSVAQAMANARDSFKSAFKMLLCLVPANEKLPDEIKHDAILLDVSLPDADKLRKIVDKTIGGCGLTVDEAHAQRAADMLRGLGGFVAETAIAMSLRKSGVVFDALLEQRVAAIEQVAGVSVYRGIEKFADVVGLAGIKRLLGRLKTAINKPRVIVIFDEFEKAMAGSQSSGGDNTGIAQRGAGHLLTWMQTKRTRGAIGFGHPGVGKSYLAQTLANELGCICILIDLGRTLDSFVGASEKNLRDVTDLIDSLSGDGGAFLFATCNSMSVLTTEMRRRFKLGTFFFDLPTGVERDAAWKYYGKKYGLDVTQPRPNDDGWTPSEIAVCCENAYEFGVPLLEASETVVPVALAQPEVIAERRQGAHNRLIDASTGKTYVMPGAIGASSSVPTGRAVAEIPES